MVGNGERPPQLGFTPLEGTQLLFEALALELGIERRCVMGLAGGPVRRDIRAAGCFAYIRGAGRCAGGRVAGGRLAGGRISGGCFAGGRFAGGRIAGGRGCSSELELIIHAVHRVAFDRGRPLSWHRAYMAPARCARALDSGRARRSVGPCRGASSSRCCAWFLRCWRCCSGSW